MLNDAVENYNTCGQIYLGNLYENGIEISKDLEKAFIDIMGYLWKFK